MTNSNLTTRLRPYVLPTFVAAIGIVAWALLIGWLTNTFLSDDISSAVALVLGMPAGLAACVLILEWGDNR